MLTIDEDHVSERLQDLLKDENNQLKVDDAARIIGCWKALSKQGLRGELGNDITPMQRTVAFCQVIEPSTGKSHKVSSKQISEMFQSVIDAYQANTKDESVTLRCEAAHVDGSCECDGEERENQLAQRIATRQHLPNFKQCSLSLGRRRRSGPGCCAIPFAAKLASRSGPVRWPCDANSQRKETGLRHSSRSDPPRHASPRALDDNKVYKSFREVLQRLRSHDDRFDAFINKVDLMQSTAGRMEVIAITDTLSPKSKGKTDKKGKGEFDLANQSAGPKDKQFTHALRSRRTRESTLREASPEMRQPSLLGRMGQRHRQDRSNPHRPHSGDPEESEEHEGDRSLRRFRQRTTRRPERQHHR